VIGARRPVSHGLGPSPAARRLLATILGMAFGFQLTMPIAPVDGTEALAIP